MVRLRVVLLDYLVSREAYEGAADYFRTWTNNDTESPGERNYSAELAPPLDGIPDYIYLYHTLKWRGLLHTRKPRAITWIDGKQILPFDTCAGIGPHLARAADWKIENNI